MKIKIIVIAAMLLPMSLMASPCHYYGRHIKGKVNNAEWTAILKKYHASRHGFDIGISEEQNQLNYDKAADEVERLRNCPSKK